MSETVDIQPRKYITLRFRAKPGGSLVTVAVESSGAPVWVLGLTAEGLDAFRRGRVKPLTDNSIGRTIGDFAALGAGRSEGVLFSTPPSYAIGKEVETMGAVGMWYVLIGNPDQSRKATVWYETW